MVFFSEKIDAVLSSGHWLGEIGVNNWALTKSSALHAIDVLEKSKIGILGGDVYCSVDGKLLPPRDNWYCNVTADEDDQAFAIRSAAKAREYVTAYPDVSEVLGFAIMPRVR